MNDLQILQDLHDSEINGEISLAWFYDSTWTVKLGDPHNGYVAEAIVASVGEAVDWLRAEAVRRYPDSDFAKRYARGFV
jgi:hypothetical protein